MRARLLIAIPIVLGMAWSWSTGAYSDLAARYPAKASFTGTPIRSRTLVVTGPQRRGATNYRDIVRVNVAPGALELQGRGLAGAMMSAIRIPRDAVRFCAKTCFGASNWSADVVLAEPALELSFENAQEIIDWCWREHVPILPQKAESAWLYEAGSLPAPAAFADQFTAREVFDAAVRNSCVGI